MEKPKHKNIKHAIHLGKENAFSHMKEDQSAEKDGKNQANREKDSPIRPSGGFNTIATREDAGQNGLSPNLSSNEGTKKRKIEGFIESAIPPLRLKKRLQGH